MERTTDDNRKLLADSLSSVSVGPGVYLMKDHQGTIIYIGKAKNLKNRLSSYFKRSDHTDMKTGVLVKKIVSFDTIVTKTEQEALILEANLVAKHKPRYNIILKDDKRYPSLSIDITQPYPNITIARKIKKDGALYFGPYASAASVHKTLKVINKTFKLRKCKNQKFTGRSRPCLNYQIGVCLAPCCHDVDENEYKKIIHEVSLFLKGRTPELIKTIKQEMVEAAEKERFEEAAQLRDKVFALEKTMEKQIVVSSDMVDRDVISITHGEELSLITVLSVRRGVLSGSRHYPFKETISDDSEIMESFIRQNYQAATWIPKEVITSIMPTGHGLIEAWLSDVKKSRVHVMTPQRGEKVRLVEMAQQNGKKELDERIARSRSELELLMRLRNRLGTGKIPEHIECFDNSNISGTEPVAGMVVFKNGKPHKSSYRKYKIKTVLTQDDYSYMAEILKRRFQKGDDKMPFPDLLMVDGGKGQLNIAMSILKELGIEKTFDVIGIAKKDETKGEISDKIYKPLRSNPINFGREGDLLLFLQRIRDEAHRFAISFHRQRRGKKSVVSALDSIPGIGKKRKEVLLKHFGGVSGIRAASVEELKKLEGMSEKAAQSVFDGLKK